MLDLIPPLHVIVIKVSNEAPKVTDYLSIIVGFAALTVAAIAAYANLQTNKNQARQLKQLENDNSARHADERRQQASRVWFHFTENHVAILRNESGLPVYNIQVWLEDDTYGRLILGTVAYSDPNDRSTPFRSSRDRVKKLAEQLVSNYTQDEQRRELAIIEQLKIWRLRGIEGHFRDASNTKWRRLTDGSLIEAPKQIFPD
ncbi:hypothetical protein [Saccharothrix texasensis]|uniref:hypothetical protein n=1 Tax=Saccharothrix texasensis TaxID=103734 RepID=UPI0011CD5A3A|nr:hypothetical protein [Saccharothrix texasensis]